MTTTAGVIAAFNHQDYIREAVESLVPWVDEVIVVNDASTDGTRDLLDQMTFDNLRVIHHETGRGVSRAFNRAVEEATSELILIQGGDDRSVPERRVLQESALADRSISMVYSDPLVINASGRGLPESVAPEFAPRPVDPLAALALGQNFICAPSAAFRREQFLAVGGFHPALDLLQDHDLWLRLAEHGSLERMHQPVVEYRKHGRNLSRDHMGLDSPKQRRMRVEQEYVAHHFLQRCSEAARLRIARAIGLDIATFAAMDREDQITTMLLSHPDQIVFQRGVARLVERAGEANPDAALARLGLTLRDLGRLTSLADHDRLGDLQRALGAGRAVENETTPSGPTLDLGAQVEEGSLVDPTVVMWRGSHVRRLAEVGAGTSLGQYVYVGPGAKLGKNCKVQNGAMIYEPADIGDGVFIGPGVVLTNDRVPRAVTPVGRPKTATDWTPVGVRVKNGASLGARVTCVAPVEIGSWAMVAAGAVVTSDVPDYALMVGVPARRIGWVGRAGERLVKEGEDWVCPVENLRYRESGVGGSVRLTPIGTTE